MAGRRKKYGETPAVKIVSVPRDKEEIWHKADEQALREGTSRSEIVNRALAEYLNMYCSAGNPQPQHHLEECKTAKVLDSYMAERARSRLKALLSLPVDTKMEQAIYSTRLEKAIEIIKKLKSHPEDIGDMLEKAIARMKG